MLVSISIVLGKMDETCPVTRILGPLGKKWALLILRELHSDKPKRFNELIKGMRGISPRTLSKRLKELEEKGLVSRKRFDEIPLRVEYSLTAKGKELIKCFNYLGGWAKNFDSK